MTLGVAMQLKNDKVSLTEYNFYFNEVDEQGAKYLADALKKNTV